MNPFTQNGPALWLDARTRTATRSSYVVIADGARIRRQRTRSSSLRRLERRSHHPLCPPRPRQSADARLGSIPVPTHKSARSTSTSQQSREARQKPCSTRSRARYRMLHTLDRLSSARISPTHSVKSTASLHSTSLALPRIASRPTIGTANSLPDRFRDHGIPTRLRSVARHRLQAPLTPTRVTFSTRHPGPRRFLSSLRLPSLSLARSNARAATRLPLLSTRSHACTQQRP